MKNFATILFFLLLSGGLFAQIIPVNLGNDTTVCEDSCIIIDVGNIADRYGWSTGDTTQFTTICWRSNKQFDTIFLAVTDTLGGAGFDTIVVESILCKDSLWPGDANANGLVDVYDILPIGQSYSFTGIPRPNASTNWVVQTSQNWVGGSAVLNYSYADCDGNGIIEDPDFAVVDLNYGLTHSKSQEPMLRRTGDPVLYIEACEDTLFVGDTLVLKVIAGDSLIPLDGLYGLAFNWAYDASLIDTALGIWYNYDSCILGIQDTTIRTLERNFFSLGQLDLGVTRIDQVDILSSGEITRVSMILIDDIAGKDEDELVPLSIFFTNVYGQLADGTEVEFDVLGDTVYIIEERDTTDTTAIGIVDLHPQFNLYPNPASQSFTLELPAGKSQLQIRIYDVAGRLQDSYHFEQPKQRQTINTGHLPVGMYYVELITDEQQAVERLLISH